MLARPGLGDCPAFCNIVDDKDQLIFVIAVENFDVHSSFGHPAGELAELARFGLMQLLDEDFALVQYFDAGRFQHTSGGSFVFEEKVCDALAVDDPAAQGGAR